MSKRVKHSYHGHFIIEEAPEEFIILDDRGVQIGCKCATSFEAEEMIDGFCEDNSQFGLGA